MKRIIIIAGIFILGAIAFGWLRGREQVATQTITNARQQTVELRQRLAREEAEQKELRVAIQGHPSPKTVTVSDPFSAELSAWLLAGKYSELPASLVPELRGLLGLAENPNSDFVLISKPTMQTLRPPSPRHDDKLSDGLCALLSISPEQRTSIQSALTAARGEFSDWGKQNVQRQGPDGATVVRYTLPAGQEFADAVTNRLLSSIADLIGTQRSELFRTYAETWFQIETGYLGGVTNTLAVLRQPDRDGQPALFYKLGRQGPNSSMSEGPGEIEPSRFPPAWRNMFPGGWPEVAQREGFELPEPRKGAK
jgi:hypothetical protein